MSKLPSIRKQIAALEAEASRITAAEMSAAVEKIKALMTAHGVTLEHLSEASGMKPRRGAKPGSKQTRAPRAGAGKPKYANPKTGQTWTGFGRVPGWLATVRNRDRFLIDQPAAADEADATPPASKRAAAKKRSASASVKSDAKAVVKRSRAAKEQPPVAVKKTRGTKSSKATPAVPTKPARARRAPKTVPHDVTPDATPDTTDSAAA